MGWSDSLGAEPVVAGHLVVLALGEAERLEDALGEAAHAEEAGPHHADHVVVARVERHLAHRSPAGDGRVVSIFQNLHQCVHPFLSPFFW